MELTQQVVSAEAHVDALHQRLDAAQRQLDRYRDTKPLCVLKALSTQREVEPRMIREQIAAQEQYLKQLNDESLELQSHVEKIDKELSLAQTAEQELTIIVAQAAAAEARYRALLAERCRRKPENTELGTTTTNTGDAIGRRSALPEVEPIWPTPSSLAGQKGVAESRLQYFSDLCETLNQ